VRRLTVSLALTGAAFGMPIKEFTALLQSSQYGGTNILCDGMPDPGMYCDCDYDCTENPDWCSCADAQACCQGTGASGSGGSQPPPPTNPFPGSCVDYKHDNENMCSIYDSTHTCQCDTWCVDYGDCCSDYDEACGSAVAKTASAMTPAQRLAREAAIKKHMGIDLATKLKEQRDKREAKLELRKELSRFFSGKKKVAAATKLANAATAK